MPAIPMIELWRGGMLESAHSGHAVVCDARGEVVEAWGDPAAVIFPRSSCKMIQALPLVESGAADRFGLGSAQLALACASHNGAHVHTEAVGRWLTGLGLGEADLRCGTQMPDDPAARKELVCSDAAPCQIHNNCSGKHAGFLTLTKHMGAGPEYVEPDHPVQRAARAAFEEVTGEASPGYGIDGCSAPNFATSVHGLARAMAGFAAANPEGSARERAAARLWRAMVAYPDLVAGEGRACTNLMRALGGKAAVKTGAEAVFVAILPERKQGIALKIVDGGTRASEAAITALLVRMGLLDAADSVVGKYLTDPLRNRRGIAVGEMRLAPGFAD
ncbi:MAG: asparaginase [Rhodobacteraceae bacterium]|jgi:L-asparaginase II|uniref:asparaginase n=1 Tax=Albidovulum sp. TaxID=1872424 RepID=UPI001DC91620|nr:asparaginase [uncultured Defluviimonas sp.]MCB2124178.1 asparaginase [Paracoccaceae bacterium]MCC0070964.1 asparaginase [Paracoccaceae bacterium]